MFRTIWFISPEVGVSEHDEGLTLLHPSNGRVLSCNRSGAAIWRGLSEGLSPGEIAAELASSYEISPEKARRDVLTFAETLQQHDLIRRKGERS